MKWNYDAPVMHGNLDAPTGLNNDSEHAGCSLWLGLPAARDHFDPARLSSADHARFVAHRNSRRRAEFEISRALLAFAGAGTTARSLSHSGGHAALLLAPSGLRVGVDLEMSQPRDVLRIARFAFHESEVRALEAAADDARKQLFYTLWTLKESLAKALQLGLVDALRQCVFTRTSTGWHGHVPTDSPWAVAVFQPRPHAFLAAACLGTAEMPPLQEWEWPPQQGASWPVIAGVTADASVAALPA